MKRYDYSTSKIDIDPSQALSMKQLKDRKDKEKKEKDKKNGVKIISLTSGRKGTVE